MARIGITLNDELNKRFEVLAELEEKKPSTLAAEILKNYMETRKPDIDGVISIRAAYEKNIAEFRKNAGA